MRKTILAIDDDEVFLGSLKDVLETEGYTVMTLSDPTKTESYIEQYAPDLLLIDIFMPKRSGFNLIEDFNSEGSYKKLPKIFLTCLDDDIERMTARACGIDIYLTKPVNPEELILKIREALKKV